MRIFAAVAASSTLLCACAGGGGGSSAAPPPPPVPTVSLTSSATDVATSGQVTLTWTSTNATSCTASGGWSGALGVSGSQAQTVTATSTYTISCTGTGGSASSNVSVTAWNAPTVALSSDVGSILTNKSASLTWTSANAKTCTGGGALSGALATSGTQASAPLAATTVFSISCSNPAFPAVTSSVTVTVSPTLVLSVIVQYEVPGPPVLASGYSLTDLGLFPGGSYLVATAINNAGTAIGYADTGINAQTSFVWSNGTLTDFSTLPGVVAGYRINGLNNVGELVGSGNNGAFYWKNGTTTDIGFFPSPSSAFSNTAYAANDVGAIVGQGYAGPGSYHAWLWKNNVYTDLGTLGGPQSQPAAINNNDVVVGRAQKTPAANHAFSWQSGAMTDLGALIPGAPDTSGALSINDSNVAVGYAVIAGSNGSTTGNEAVKWENGVATILMAPDAALAQISGTSAEAEALNSSGQIVGIAFSNSTSARRAVTWINGQIVDLNSLVLATDPLKASVTLTNAVGINNGGVILATDSRTGAVRSYLLTPATGQYYVPDWNHPQHKPVPFVSVELRNAGGVIVQQTYTDANGVATFTGLDPTITYTPVVKAKVQQVALGLDFEVVDNTSPVDTAQPIFRARYAPYEFAAAAYTAGKSASQSQVLTAQDGWDASTGTLVDANRLAGPFALLANAVTEAQIVSAAVGGFSLTWRPLTILWSTKNKGALSAPPNDYDRGLATGSGGFYVGGHGAIDPSGSPSGSFVAEDFIFMSGDQTYWPMDIYPNVMTHEMGHFSQSQFSTRNSSGGNHRSTDYEDQTLSWVEGNASGIAALVMNTPLQYFFGYLNGQIIVDGYDVSTDLVDGIYPANSPLGWYQENTVTRLIWGLHDPAKSINLTAAAALAPMFTPAWKAGPWFNTVWAYLAQLKALNSSNASAIDAFAGSLNVTSAGNDVWGSTETHPGNRVAMDVLPPYVAVPIGPVPTTVCSAGAPLEYNKEGNVRYIQITGDGNTHTVTVQGPAGTVPLLNRGYFVAGSSTLSASGTIPASGLVLNIGDCGVALGEYPSDTAACNDPAPPAEQCWSVTVQ